MPPNPITEGCREARSRRRTFGYGKEQPIDPWALAHQLGITVVIRPLGERRIAGAYLYRPAESRSFVLINATDILSRQRFTLAHEIGHFTFDRESIIVDDDSQSGSQPEKRANAFAAELLLPEVAVRNWKPRAPWGDSPEDPGLLAAAYGVSFEVTLWRLKTVGLLENVDALKPRFGEISSTVRATLSARGDEVTQYPEEFVRLTNAALDAELISKKKYLKLREDLREATPF